MPDALLFVAHATLDVLRWDPMADESLFYQHAPSGHVLRYDQHVGLTAMRDLFVKREWDPILVELEATAMQLSLLYSQQCSHPSGGFSPLGCTMHSELSRPLSIHNPTLQIMWVEISTPQSAECPNPACQAQTPRSQPASSAGLMVHQLI
jgi:hypothetical protein